MTTFVLKIKDLDKTLAKGYAINEYTCFQGFVIVALSEEGARDIASEYDDGSANRSGPWWLDPEVTTCQIVDGDGMPCVVLADTSTG